MGVLDKFLNAMKMNDDDGYEDDYLDEEDDYDYDDFENERPKKRILSKVVSDDYDRVPAPTSQNQPPVQERQASAPKQSKLRNAVKSSSKVSPMRSRKIGGMEVCVIRPTSMTDASEIVEILQSDCTVILNMEGIDMDLAQRIIDVTSGACYALRGNLQRISSYIFIVTPQSVDISGDFQDFLSGAFDVPAFGTRY